MKTYPIGLVPGPVSVPKDIREVYAVHFGKALDVLQEILNN